MEPSTDPSDKSLEALTKFQQITESKYANKNLGGSGQKETMTCDCLEQWDETTATNWACGADLNCINRFTSVECTNKNCLCGSDCQNQRFQKRQYAQVKVVDAGKKGYGLAATEDLAPGQFVYEYIGEVIDEPTFRSKMLEYDQRKIRHFYFMMLTKDAFIDATERGSLARFCNHSCSPNAYVDKWVVGDKLRMGIFAKSVIKSGEEITFDYNVDRYGAQQHPCYCGSANCLGWIGGKTQTDAALLLPESISEALGVSSSQERAWLKQNKKARATLQSPEAAVNEDFVNQLEVTPLEEQDVSKAMAALMKADEDCVVAKLVERIYLTSDAKLNTLIVRFHGYKTLSRVLKDRAQDATPSFVLQILQILKRWPTMTRNKIELSQIEDVVENIRATSSESEVVTVAEELLGEWSKLEMAYRIPKGVADVSSTFIERNPRLQSPISKVVDGSDSDELPTGWQKALDPNTNTVYYYHTGLGISKWEKPTGVPTGPKNDRQDKKKVEKKARKEKPRKFPAEKEFKLTQLEEDRLQKLKEEQFNEVREKEKMLHELILQSQRDAEEKKKAEEEARISRIERHKEKRRRAEQIARKKKERKDKLSEVSPLTLWMKAFAKHIPNMIKKYEGEIGHENVKGCAKDLVKILAEKEIRKHPESKPSQELERAKLKKLKEFSDQFMEKFLLKYRAKRARKGEQKLEEEKSVVENTS